MSKIIELHAADGHNFDAYLAEPVETPKAGIVLLQEIFGINGFLRSVADDLAKQGYLTLVPALFDRVRKHVELAYDDAGVTEGKAMMAAIPQQAALADIYASMIYLQQQFPSAKIGVVGYCWGGTLAWLSNTRLRPDATVSYYPGGIQKYITEKATCPAIFHFGTQDASFPPSVIDQVQQEYPGFPVYTYEAGHGFSSSVRPSYNKEATILARQRTLAHLHEHLVATPH